MNMFLTILDFLLAILCWNIEKYWATLFFMVMGTINVILYILNY